ncbi:Acetyl esterase [Ruegeria sp. THAF57]|uniref:alpha/beta hydrolase n=1 Tax=Ruegeria sp. THAF57 TaxID=2744555 RepID=UPI0015DF634B|nr:alpha/beta hydrolase [Ruegeria sp. THAF57]CAD0187194.1 Acetyl esterase [Ruegeria sp. THAF57]
MTADNLNPELRDAFRMVPVFPYYGPRTIPLGRMMYNKATPTKTGPGVTVEEVMLGDLSLRVFRPIEGASGAGILWIHGGGFIAGATEQVNDVVSGFARRLKAAVVTVQYRWAPEHPFPAALDDVHAAWRWMLDAPDIDSARIAILGQSAGGGLAAGLVQRLHDEGGQQPVAQVLHYPMLDDRTAADLGRDAERYRIWNNRCNRVAWNAYLHPLGAGADGVPPYAAPARRQDLSGLPPTWIGGGTYDLFADETRDYATRLERAGVSVDSLYLEGAPHVFEVMAPDWSGSVQFLNSTARFLRRYLQNPSG